VGKPDVIDFPRPPMLGGAFLVCHRVVAPMNIDDDEVLK